MSDVSHSLDEEARAIEAILMVAEDPVPTHLLAQLLELAPDRIDGLCAAMAAAYEAEGRGFQLVRVAGGYRFQSHPDQSAYVERFVLDGQSARLSAAALETLAIVAYKQPISRGRIAAIRGVNVDGVIRTLAHRGYIAEVGARSGSWPGDPLRHHRPVPGEAGPRHARGAPAARPVRARCRGGRGPRGGPAAGVGRCRLTRDQGARAPAPGSRRSWLKPGWAAAGSAEELIAAGRVKVNGRVAELGNRVDPERDRVEVDGVAVGVAPGLVYYLVNKPAGVVTTAADTHGRPTVLELVPAAPRVFSVGRLDQATEGLLLVTNDGDLAHRLTHPSFGVDKEYLAEVEGAPSAWRPAPAAGGRRVGRRTDGPGPGLRRSRPTSSASRSTKGASARYGGCSTPSATLCCGWSARASARSATTGLPPGSGGCSKRTRCAPWSGRRPRPRLR